MVAVLFAKFVRSGITSVGANRRNGGQRARLGHGDSLHIVGAQQSQSPEERWCDRSRSFQDGSPGSRKMAFAGTELSHPGLGLITARPKASIGDENASCAPAHSNRGERLDGHDRRLPLRHRSVQVPHRVDAGRGSQRDVASHRRELPTFADRRQDPRRGCPDPASYSVRLPQLAAFLFEDLILGR